MGLGKPPNAKADARRAPPALQGEPTSHVYFSQRLRLRYVDWGNNNASPMLLVHGARDHCRNWDWVAQGLKDSHHVVAPDLRGHGDSQWLVGAAYATIDYVYDIAQLIHQTNMDELVVIGHSLGGSVALAYAGLYPERVRKLIAIEGMGMSPGYDDSTPGHERLRAWVGNLRQLSGRIPKRYPTLEDAFQRMQQANPHLTAAQARHLTIHGSNQNEDGTYSWKFDNYARAWSPVGLSMRQTFGLYRRIACPTLLIHGTESWASDPKTDGRLEYFQNARSVAVENAGHWVHHDQLEQFLALVRDFLADD